MKCYTGIGSRNITFKEEQSILRVSSGLKERGYIVYSGNADGSDITFQKGSDGQCVIYLPWKNFNKQNYNINKSIKYFVPYSEDGELAIKKFHPCPKYILSKRPLTNLMVRNYHQINGYEDFPITKFVICCATVDSNGDVIGGTGQAVKIALDMGIPVVNIRKKTWKKKLKRILDEVENG